MTRITLENVEVTYPAKSRRERPKKVLDDISVDITEGDKVGISGEQGAGKSTLLRVLGGIYPPVSGRVTIEGSVRAMFNIGAATNPRFTVRENLEIIGLLRGYNKAARQNLIEDVADFGDLHKQIHEPLGTLSSGMKMRMFFTVATFEKSDIVLLDEWMSLGDSDFREKAKSRLDSLVGEAGILVLASNSQRSLQIHCNRFLHLEHGCLVQD